MKLHGFKVWILGIVCIVVVSILFFIIKYSEFLFFCTQNNFNVVTYFDSIITEVDREYKNFITNNVSLRKEKNEKINAVDHCWLNDILYIDLISNYNGEKKHIILKYDKNMKFTKYIDNNSSMIKNYQNIKFDLIDDTFTRLRYDENQNEKYIDPFIHSSVFGKKIRQIGLNEKIEIPPQNNSLYFTVYETIDQFETENIELIVYPKGTDIAVLALSNAITVKQIVSLFSEDPFDNNGYLIDDETFCVAKEIRFRYGRQAELNDPDKQNKISLINEWDFGSGKYSLGKLYISKNLDDLINFEIINRPAAMDHCDEYYKQSALEILSKGNFNF